MAKKPGLIRRFFTLLGKLGSAVRTLINVAFLLIFLVIIASLFGQNIQPLPEKAALRVAPGGFLVDQKTYADPLTQLMEQSSPADAETLTRDLVDAIELAATDNRITSLVLELDQLVGGGISKLEEIGAALDKFKQTDKPIIAVGNSYTQEQYYLASYADEIHLNPMGVVVLNGFGSYPNYFKSALEKLDINVHVFRVGVYKDAIEPLIRDDMSAESREHTSEWLHSLWNAYTRRVEALRSLPTDAINDYSTNLAKKLTQYQGNSAQLALNSGLVDKLSNRPEMADRLKAVAGTDNDGSYRHIDFQTYLSHLRRAKALQPATTSDRIGVIVAKGAIMGGDQPAGTAGSDTLAELFRQVREDQSIRAIVLRVDSPGGGVFASDLILQEIKHTQSQGTPVIVSMGSVAASGGYWIASTADQIWATPTTITGSIGVFGILPTFENTLSNMGINSDGVGTTPLADIYHLDRPLSPEAAEVIQLGVNDIYNHFLKLVADARNSTPEDIHKIAQGRVWTGNKALELGLVDRLGTLKDAIAAAAEHAGIKQYEVEYISRPLSFQEKLIRELAAGNEGVAAGLKSSGWLPQRLVSGVKNLTDQLGLLTRLNDPRGIYLQCLECTSR